MITDPVSDFLIQIKNGYMARKNQIVIPCSKMRESLARLLNNAGYIGKINIMKDAETKSKIAIDLIYKNNQPKVTEIIMVSKPGRRVYQGKDQLPRVLGGGGIAIISTPSGLMTDKEARKKSLGGEVICKIW